MTYGQRKVQPKKEENARNLISRKWNKSIDRWVEKSMNSEVNRA